MVKDTRTTREPVSGYAVWAAGDSGSSADVLTVRGNVATSLNDVLVSYDATGTTEETVELYDDDEGTAAADLTGQFDQYNVSPGENLPLDEIVREDVDNDVVAVVSNNDAQVVVSVGGHVISG